jgi:hypothetical protein
MATGTRARAEASTVRPLVGGYEQKSFTTVLANTFRSAMANTVLRRPEGLARSDVSRVCSSGIASMTRRDEVIRRVIDGVAVLVVNAKAWVASFAPLVGADRCPAPVAWERAIPVSADEQHSVEGLNLPIVARVVVGADAVLWWLAPRQTYALQ